MISLHSYALATVEEAQLVLGISGNEDRLRFLINYATDYIETKTGRRFLSTAYSGVTAEKMQATGGRDLFAKNYPITAVSSLEFNNTNDNSSDWETVETTDYFYDADAGIITLTSRSILGNQNYRLSYTGGYTTIPSDLKMACIWLVGESYKRSPNLGIKSESLGDHSVVFDASLLASKDNPVSKVISSYRRMLTPGWDS